MATASNRVVTVFGGTGFLGQGIRIVVMRYWVPIIPSFDRLRSTFAMRGQLPMRLLMLMAQ
jgi:hypothetical protein